MAPLGRSDRHGFLADVIVTVLEPAERDNVDGDSQEMLERLLQIHEIEKRTARLELDKEVDVALWRVVAPGDRAKQRHGTTTVMTHELVDLATHRLDKDSALSHVVNLSPASASSSGD